MSAKRDYSLCIDCRHQKGTWVNDREVDTWCTLGKTSDCDETFECRYFEGYDERFTVPVKYRFSHSKIQLNGEPLTNDELVRILNTNDGAFVENFALKQENEMLKQQVQKIHKLINGKIQSAREVGSVRTVVALKNLQRELTGDIE